MINFNLYSFSNGIGMFLLEYVIWNVYDVMSLKMLYFNKGVYVYNCVKRE